jgi:uncharacterized protein
MPSTPPINRSNHNRSRLALCLIVPISSIAASASTLIAPGPIGQGIAVCCWIWMVVFPILWHLVVERQKLKIRVTSSDGWLVGIILGILMFGLIFGGYWFVGRYWLNIPDIRARVGRLGMNIPLMIFGFGTFQTLVNSFIEEYVWRWFVYRHCELLWSKTRAVWISAGFFTLHHIILMIAYYDDWRLILFGSIAIFIAGVLWARCAKIYNSLVPSYLSHLAADLALQIASWHVLLG